MLQTRKDAALKRERALSYAFSHQVRNSVRQQVHSSNMFVDCIYSFDKFVYSCSILLFAVVCWLKDLEEPRAVSRGGDGRRRAAALGGEVDGVARVV